MSQFEIIGTPAMRDFKRYVMPFSVYSVSNDSCFLREEWVVKISDQFGVITQDTAYDGGNVASCRMKPTTGGYNGGTIWIRWTDPEG